MSRKTLLWAGGSFVLLLLAGIAIVAFTFRIPSFEGLEGIDLGELEDDKIATDMRVKMHNPNFFSLGGRKLSYVVAFHDTVIGRGAMPEGFLLTGSDTTLVTLPADLELPALSAVHQSLLAQKKARLDVLLEGEFGFVNKAMSLDFQFELATATFMKELLQVLFDGGGMRFSDLSWKKIDTKESEFGFRMVVSNPMEAPVLLKSAQMAFSTEDPSSKPEGSWKLAEALVIKPKASVSLPALVRVTHGAVVKGVLPGIFKGELRYNVAGSLAFELGELPFMVPISGVFVFKPLQGTGEFEAGG